MEQLLQYATKRISELESLLLVEVTETVWPAEVSMIYGQVENAGNLPAHHQRRLKHHINRMWLGKGPSSSRLGRWHAPWRSTCKKDHPSIAVRN